MSEPLFVWSPPRERSLGKLACDLVSTMKLKGRPYEMDVHQAAILEDIFAEGAETGVPAASNVTVIAPRQNLKTGVLIAAALADLFVLEVDRHVWTAHLQRTVRGTFREMRSLIASNGDIKGMCRWPPTTGNAQMAIELRSGQMIEFFTRSTGGGRGEAGDKNTLDEGLFLTDDDLDAILPTMATMPWAQARIGSSAGLGHSKVLRRYRDRGRASSDPSAAYWEFGAPVVECRADPCDHLDLDDAGCALNDRELWRRANPALGVRIRESFLVGERRDLSPGGFAREHLSWWDEPDELEHPIDPDAWKRAGIDKQSPDAAVPLAPIAISVACSADLSTSTIGVAGVRPDGKAQVELAKRARGTAWPVQWVLDRVEKRKPCAVVINPAGRAGFLIEKLRKARVDVLEPTSREYAQACGDLRATVNEGKVTDPETGQVRSSELVHTFDPVLTSAVHAVEAKPSGAWIEENEKADISALDAATLALFGLRHGIDPTSVYESRGLTVL